MKNVIDVPHIPELVEKERKENIEFVRQHPILIRFSRTIDDKCGFAVLTMRGNQHVSTTADGDYFINEKEKAIFDILGLFYTVIKQ